MKSMLICLLVFVVHLQFSEQLLDLLNTPTHKCIECLCHARTGCYRRKNCASYSIDREYWGIAGHPIIPGDNPDDAAAYTRCMQHENCILNTIFKYTSTFNNRDCNCDGTFDCQDMLKLHLFGGNCGSIMDSNQVRRFNNCAKKNGMTQMTSNAYCQVEAE